METWDEKAVFLKALALSGEARETYLREACPDDAARQRIETLIHHHREATTAFLDADEDATQPGLPETP